MTPKDKTHYQTGFLVAVFFYLTQISAFRFIILFGEKKSN
jgi:hypothetical protein